MRVLAYDPCPDPHFSPSGRFLYSPIPALLESSEIISLHCPFPGDAKPLLGREKIAALRRGSYLVNTSRAELLDEEAVLEALDSGQLSGFATDVFVEEPPRDRRLVGHPRVIATPHIGGFTEESVTRAVEVAVDNLLAVLNCEQEVECT
jgi:phosphoglycerate dehydrogenase-like enzyme